jgi:hypothetical protein
MIPPRRDRQPPIIAARMVESAPWLARRQVKPIFAHRKFGRSRQERSQARTSSRSGFRIHPAGGTSPVVAQATELAHPLLDLCREIGRQCKAAKVTATFQEHCGWTLGSLSGRASGAARKRSQRPEGAWQLQCRVAARHRADRSHPSRCLRGGPMVPAFKDRGPRRIAWPRLCRYRPT